MLKIVVVSSRIASRNQEDSRIDDVIEIGLRYITKIESEHMKKDAALAVAIAFYEKARVFSSAPSPSMSEASEQLTYALNTIDSFGVSCSTGEHLKAEAEKLLKTVTPKSVLETLSKPITPQHAAARGEAMRGLQAILWSEKSFFQYPDGKNAFQNHALSLLTPAEQIRLYESMPETVDVTPAEMYDASLAYIAQGFLKRKPSLVQRGARLLDELVGEEGSGPRAVARTLELAVERGACALLLGDTKEALSLMLDERRADPDIKNYIYSKSDVKAIRDPYDRDTYGVCKLVEEWIEIKLFSLYRNTANRDPSLKDWFKSTSVAGFMRWRQLISIQSVGDVVSLVPRATTFAVTSAMRAYTRMFRPIAAREALKSDGLLTTGMGFTAPAPKGGMSAGEVGFEGGTGSGRQVLDDIQRIGPIRSPTAGTYFVLVGLIGLLSMIKSSDYRAPRERQPTASAMHSTARLDGGTVSANVLSTRKIEAIIRQWQLEKSRALGRSHDSSRLHEILCGDMLASWADKAESTEQKGIWWQYSLRSMQIESVTQTARNRVVAVVKLEETARLHGVPHASRPSSYRSEYRARYAIVLKDNVWKIESGSVLADE